MSELLLLAGIGGAAAVAAGSASAAPAAKPPMPQPPKNVPGVPIGQANQARTGSARIKRYAGGGATAAWQVGVGSGMVRVPQGNQPGAQTDKTMGKQVEDAIDKKAREEYEKLDRAARQAIADKANKELIPSPGIKADDSYEEMSKKIGASVGAAAGVSACAAAGLEIAGPLCAKAGYYLGEKLGEFVYEVGQKIEEGADYIYEKGIKEIGNKVEEAYDWVGDTIGGLF